MISLKDFKKFEIAESTSAILGGADCKTIGGYSDDDGCSELYEDEGSKVTKVQYDQAAIGPAPSTNL